MKSFPNLSGHLEEGHLNVFFFLFFFFCLTSCGHLVQQSGAI